MQPTPPPHVDAGAPADASTTTAPAGPSEALQPEHSSPEHSSPGHPTLRDRVRALVEDRRFQGVITTLIIINAVVLGIETYPSNIERFGQVLEAINAVVLAVFVVELVLRLWAHGWPFFKDGWNVFDFLIVVISLIPVSGGLQILRVLRVLRVLRLISSVPALRKVVGALISAVPGIAAIGGLLVLIMYVFIVACTMLFGTISPAAFGDLGRSTISLFRLLNGDGWGELVAPLATDAPYAWPFMMIYGLISTFIILNLFIAVTCEALESQKEESTVLSVKERALMDEVEGLRAAMERIEARLTASDPAVRDRTPEQ